MTAEPTGDAARRAIGGLLLAAGEGRRLGLPVAKAFVALGAGPMFVRSLRTMAESGVIGTTVVIAPAGHVDAARRAVVEAGLEAEVSAVVAGGATRQESVRLGLEALPPEVRIAVCHDAARPFASPRLFRRVVEAIGDERGEDDVAGAVPVLAPTDTVKRVRGSRIVETIPREEVGLAQTPQAFLTRALRECHESALRDGRAATDDAMLLEAMGYPVAVVEGEVTNFKVTSPADLLAAEQALLAMSREASG